MEKRTNYSALVWEGKSLTNIQNRRPYAHTRHTEIAFSTYAIGLLLPQARKRLAEALSLCSFTNQQNEHFIQDEMLLVVLLVFLSLTTLQSVFYICQFDVLHCAVHLPATSNVSEWTWSWLSLCFNHNPSL